MAKLTRFTLPVFAGSATQTQTSVFGTMKTSPEYTTDVAAAINTQAYSDGWFEAIELGYAPFVEDMNSLQRAITYQISYGQQQGIPEWASDTEYYVGSFAKLNTATGAQVYCSLVDNNVGNLVSDTTKWKLVLDTANSYVTTNTAQTITGAKTFSVSPLVPTATSGDSSTKAANTEFVSGVSSDLQTQINAKATPANITTSINNLLSSLYPVGSIYIGTQNTCPLASLISGSTWTLVAQDRALWGGNGSNANTTIAAGLPNITGTATRIAETWNASGAATGALTKLSGGYIGQATPTGVDASESGGMSFDASRSSSIYGQSSTVQPPAYRVNVWRRTA